MGDIITQGRTAVDRLILRDTCTVETQTTSYTDGVLSDDSPALLYSGKCRVKPATPEDLVVADGQYDTHMYMVTLPHDADGIPVGAVVTVTSTDGDLDGAELVVSEVPHASTFSILRRLVCRKVVAA